MSDFETENAPSNLDEENVSRWRYFYSRFLALEPRFLGLLRGSSLVIATLTLLAAAVLFSYGLIQQLGRTQVSPDAVSVAAEDVIPTKDERTADKEKPTPVAKLTAGEEVRAKTLKLYRAAFKRFDRPGNKIEDNAVVDLVWSEERIKAFDALGNSGLTNGTGEVLDGRHNVMKDSLSVVETASKAAEFQRQLTAYRDAKKVNVCKDVVKTRQRSVSGWDSYATSCVAWYESPVGCRVTRTIDEPYVTKVCEMKFPEELESPAQLLANSVGTYGVKADAKLTQARNSAESETADNHARKSQGLENVVSGGKLFIGFLTVMFLYLFIALERHHRSLKIALARGNAPSGGNA